MHYFQYSSPADPAPPANAWDLLHPYYRAKVADVVVPVIAILGIGFVGYTTYKTYFKGVDTKPELKESMKKLWTNAQGGFIGGAAFTLFIALLVSVQRWVRGTSLPKSLSHLGNQLKEASGLAQLT